MAKNLMPEIAKLLGVEINEVFEVTNGKHTNKAIVTNNTFCEITREGTIHPNSLLFQLVLKGEWAVKKLPWEPRVGETYYFPDVFTHSPCLSEWEYSTKCLALKALGLVYPTPEEVRAHFPRDYEKLTGKKWRE